VRVFAGCRAALSRLAGSPLTRARRCRVTRRGFNKFILLTDMRDAARNFVAADDTLTVSVELRITHTTNWGL
jgi:hypothetical protein